MKTLNWDLSVFDIAGNRCYCEDCFPKNWINSQVIAGETYIIPRGWMRFGLKVPTNFSKINNSGKIGVRLFRDMSKECIFNNYA